MSRFLTETSSKMISDKNKMFFRCFASMQKCNINRNAPVLIRTPKLTRFEPAQYWGGGPPGNSVVLNPFFEILQKKKILLRFFFNELIVLTLKCIRTRPFCLQISQLATCDILWFFTIKNLKLSQIQKIYWSILVQKWHLPDALATSRIIPDFDTICFEV